MKKISYDESQIENIKDYLVTRITKENTTVPLDLKKEVAFNPYLNCDSFAEFLAIRKLKDVY